MLAASVDTTHTRVALTDHGGHVLADRDVEVAVADGPAATFDALATAARSLLHGSPGDRVCGIGVGVPGPVDPATGQP